MSQALADLVASVCGILSFAILMRAVLSWFQLNSYNPAMRLLIRVTDPILLPIQRVLPNFGGLDLSPLVAILILQALPTVVAVLLLALGG